MGDAGIVLAVLVHTAVVFIIGHYKGFHACLRLVERHAKQQDAEEQDKQLKKILGG